MVVETPAAEGQSFDQSRDIQEAVDDAVDLGADVVRVEARDVVTGIQQIAEARDATHVFVPYRAVSGLRRLRERSLVDQLLERMPALEVHTVGAKSPDGRG